MRLLGAAAALLVACAAPQSPGPALGAGRPAATVDAGVPTADAGAAAADAGAPAAGAERPLERATATDACAEFNRQQQQALSPAEHMRVFGCPPCPCACVKGRVTCAPCAACSAFGDPRRPGLAPKVTGPRPADAGR